MQRSAQLSRQFSLARQVVRQVVHDVWAAQAMEWAAALACYVLLSLFPLLLAGAALISFVVPPAVVTEQLSRFVEGALPPGLIDLQPIVDAAIASRRQVGVLAVALWLLSGRRILGALVTALDRVSDVDARQETVQRRAFVELALLAGLGVVFLIALAARPLLNQVVRPAEGAPASMLTMWIGAGMQIVLLLAVFYCLYAFVPRGRRHPLAAFIGAVTATVLVLVVRALMMTLLDRLWPSYALVYGPLALAALLLTWSWLLGLIVLFGGSLASHVKVMAIEGHQPREAERRHVAQKGRP